jgi:ornithine cyclodeaminase
MAVLIVDQRQVERLLSMAECIELMRDAFERCARGAAQFPLRPFIKLPDRRGVLAMMPGYLSDPLTIGVKVISVYPGNLGTPLDAHQGAIMLFDPTDGHLAAIIDASAVTAIRTAAASAVATDLLARRDIDTLAILGSGVQARTHVAAMHLVRPVRCVRVWSRTPERARALATDLSRRLGLSIDVAPSAAEAVTGAGVVCTTTGARDPILQGAWLSPGAHVNAVGSASPTMRELDTQAVIHARVFVDSRESARHEAGDLLIPMKEGAFSEDHIAGEIGDVITGDVVGRRTDREITLFKSLGVAAQDLAAARFIVEKAINERAGTTVELGGWRETGDM